MRVPATETENASPRLSDRRLRLAERLTVMLPGIAAVQVGLADPRRQWPHPRAVAVDTYGQRVPLARAASQVVARWVVRTWPEVEWVKPHTLDLATGQLTAGAGTAARGR
ncbi:transcriptional regulator [Kitasatospora phosalacinea]|uniref:transcriptional regulator n=1 Tax=Kitasatospora phosalacinea TaxID=2065 RepID=UPI003665AF9F